MLAGSMLHSRRHPRPCHVSDTGVGDDPLTIVARTPFAAGRAISVAGGVPVFGGWLLAVPGGRDDHPRHEAGAMRPRAVARVRGCAPISA